MIELAPSDQEQIPYFEQLNSFVLQSGDRYLFQTRRMRLGQVFIALTYLSMVSGFRAPLSRPVGSFIRLEMMSSPDIASSAAKIAISSTIKGASSNRKDFFSVLDRDGDGRVSIAEMLVAEKDVISSFLVSTSHPLQAIRKLLGIGSTNSVDFKAFVTNLKRVVNPIDALIIVGLLLVYKSALREMFNFTSSISKKMFRQSATSSSTDKKYPTYEESIFGYIEKPLGYTIYFLPFLYALDILSLALHAFGVQFHLKSDLPRLLVTVVSSIIMGSWITKIKDWVFYKMRAARNFVPIFASSSLHNQQRDKAREDTVDELASLVVWAGVAVICLEAMSLEFGFALGSVFAVGGIGSASVVLALRSTMENIIGGVLIKLQDKFRVGESITIPKSERGIVAEITYTSTYIRKDDNSVVVVPNHIFSHGEIINWSRTPYRLFKTQLNIGLSELQALPKIVSTIQTRLGALEGIETSERDLLVSASAFKDGKIVIDIEAHCKNDSEEKLASLRTKMVNVIAEAATLKDV